MIDPQMMEMFRDLWRPGKTEPRNEPPNRVRTRGFRLGICSGQTNGW